MLDALASAASQGPWELIWARFVLGIAVGAASFVSPMYISEPAPKRIRGGVTSFNQVMVVAGIFVSYIVNWALVSTFFLTLAGAITAQGTFWLYAGFGIAALLFFAFRLSETKNRSLEEISKEVTDEAAEAT